MFCPRSVVEVLPGVATSSAHGLLAVLVVSSVCPLAANAPDTRVVLCAEVALGGLTATAPDFSVERGAVPFAYRRSALRANAAIEFATILLARRRSTAFGSFGARSRTRLATRGGVSTSRHIARSGGGIFRFGSLLAFCHEMTSLSTVVRSRIETRMSEPVTMQFASISLSAATC